MLWVVLLSIFLSVGLGGYWFLQVIDHLGADARKQTIALLELEEVVGTATLAYTQQTQEWKDMLLHSHDPALFAAHRLAMKKQAEAVCDALLHARAVMRAHGLETQGIASLEQQEKALLDAYNAAAASADRANPHYYRLVDEKVGGKDRNLHDELTLLQSQLRSSVSEKLSLLGEDGRARAISDYFIQIGLIAVLLPLLSLAAFFNAYRAVRAIGKSDARARTIYESIGDAVLVADKEGRVDTLNEIAQKLTGWSQRDAQGRPLSEVFQLFDAANHQRVRSPAEIVLLNGCAIPMSNGMILRRPDGSEVAIEDSASPVVDEKGRVSAVVMVFHDVSQRYAMMQKLRHERALFRQTFDLAGVGMAQLAMSGKWSRVNRKLCEITGYSESELLRLSFQGITHPEHLARDVDALDDLLHRRSKIYETESRYIRKDGSPVWIALTQSLVWNEDGTPHYGISIVQDIQARKNAERTAASSQAQYQALFEQMPEGVLLIDDDMMVVAHNREALLQLEYDSEALLKLHISDFEAVDDLPAIAQRMLKTKQAGRDNFESRYRTRTGRLMDVDVSVQMVHLPDGKPVFQTLFHDITEQKLAAAQIEHLAYHDQLTGLANRRLLKDRIDHAVGASVRRNANIAVCYMDLDHFKDVNDSLGHQAGDRLLQMVASRLLSCVRAEDTLSRVGGDEFVLMLADIADSEDAAAIAHKIIHEISAPYTIEHEEIRITPSIGISICPQDGRDSDTLLKHADSALYQAKQSGRATCRFYTEALHQKAMERLKIERLLCKAIENEEFELHYQPQVDLQTNNIIGCEALIRWNHPGMGQVPPAQFIPIAEHSNLIIDIGAWVIRNVCIQAKRWQDQGHKLKVSFNVSARQFMRPEELLQTLESAIRDSGVNPVLLELELTESLLLDPQGMSEILNQIQELGLSLALDDFGTGYSSLSYLRRFPIHILKIDRSFVSDADCNDNDAEMVKTIIGMAHNLRMSLVAEGVETAAQLLLLATEGCEVAQGFHFSRPVPVEEFDAMLGHASN